MPTKKDHYIRALEYAESRSTFTLDELVESVGLNLEQKKQLALQIHQNQIFNQNASDYINNYESLAIDLHFSVEDKFRLLNYIALQEARNSSKSATLFAVFALFVSLLSFVVSASLSYMQLKSTINIPEDFVEKIENISKVQAETGKAILEMSRNISHRKNK